MKISIHWTPRIYDLLAPIYDLLARWFLPMGEVGRAVVLKDMTAGSILDVGCGTGELLLQAELIGLDSYGVDRSGGMLRQARHKIEAVPLQQGSFYDLPFADNSFDFVVETNAVSGSDIHSERVIAEMFRVCKPGGEIRFADYGAVANIGEFQALLIRIGELFGDRPFGYEQHLMQLGYDPQIEALGWNGMYQFIRVRKRR